MALKIGKYEFCILDLIFENGKLSLTKIARIIAYYSINRQYLLLDNPSEMQTLTFAAIMMIDNGIIMYMKWRFPRDMDSKKLADDSGGADGDDDNQQPDSDLEGLAAQRSDSRPKRTAKRPMRGGKGRNKRGIK